MHDYMRKKWSKATLPPSPEKEEANSMADPSPSPEQDAEVMEAVDILPTLNKASSYETRSWSKATLPHLLRKRKPMQWRIPPHLLSKMQRLWKQLTY